jgi:Mn-dependent DtxR family transcriptional regulator
MVTLQDRILLLFDDAHPAMVCTEIARILDVPHEEVQDELRRMARKSLVHKMEHRGKIGITITPEGEGARDVFVTTFVTEIPQAPEAALDPDSVLSSL